MKYRAGIVDVHGDHHPMGDGLYGSMDIDAATPCDGFEVVIRWCRQHNVMPEWIDVQAIGADGKTRSEREDDEL